MTTTPPDARNALVEIVAGSEPADDLVQLNNLDRLPSKHDVLLALETIQRANGADLDEWTRGALPSDDIHEALAAIKSSRENEDAR